MEYKELAGKKITKVKHYPDDHKITLATEDGWQISFEHEQDCCEYVRITSDKSEIEELRENLVGKTLIHVQEEKIENEQEDNLDMSTFYIFTTAETSTTIAWRGCSNGYYSVGVTVRMKRGNEEFWLQPE